MESMEHTRYVNEFYDDCHDRKTSSNRNNWLSAVVVVIILVAIAWIWQHNNHCKVLEAKEIGELKAKSCYDHEKIGYLAHNQRQDEQFGFWERPYHQPCAPVCAPAPACAPVCAPQYSYGLPNGYGYPNSGPQGYNHCGYNPWPVNGCPPYPIPVTKVEKFQRYEAKGCAEICETETV